MNDPKYMMLQSLLLEAKQVAVAFSGGTDSAFLLAAAREILGEQVIAVTVRSPIFPQSEQLEAEDFCRTRGIRQIMIDTDLPDPDAFEKNPPDRCYHCKRALFSRMTETAAENGFAVITDGSNCDDSDDFRPGMRAVSELGIRSLLREAGFYKSEIRALSHEMGLPTWDKPSMACLASRIPYGEPITAELLNSIGKAEAYLQERGFRQVRVRVSNHAARIEIPTEQFQMLLNNRVPLTAYLRSLGFSYISLDLQGYRTGSMNETLSENDKVRYLQNT